jgi:chromosome segregation ATPase
MNEEPTKDLATRAFYKRVLDEFAAVRKEQTAMREDLAEIRSPQAAMRVDLAAMREDLTEIRSQQAAMREDVAAIRQDIAEIRSQQAAMARNIAALDQRVIAVDQRLTSLEQRVDARLQETRPIWEAVQEQLRKIAGKFDLVLNDLYEVRLDIRGHERRLTSLENRPA